MAQSSLMTIGRVCQIRQIHTYPHSLSSHTNIEQFSSCLAGTRSRRPLPFGVGRVLAERNNAVVVVAAVVREPDDGRRQHGHRRGFVAAPPPMSSAFVIDTEVNFLVGAPYDQEDFPDHAKNMVLAAALDFCEARAVEREAVSPWQLESGTPIAQP